MAIWEFEYIDVDLKNEENILSGKCKQNDTLTFTFNIYDNGINADLSSTSILLKANKDEKAYEIRDTDITISNNTVKVKCPSSVTQYAGELKLELCFMNTSSGLQKSSFDIILKVKKSVLGNTDGTVPAVIITPLEQLDTNLAELVGTIADAKVTNNTLSNTNTNANNTNTTLQTTINNANVSKINLDNSKNVANASKSALDSSVLLAQQFISFFDTLSAGAPVTDETSTNITTETGAIWTL